MGKHNDDQVLSYGDAFLRKSDLSSLDSGKWLTDAVITFSFEYFEKEAFKDYTGNDFDSHQLASHSQSLNVSIPTYNTRSRAINRNRSLSTSLGTFASNPFLSALSDSNDMDSNQISNRRGSNRLNFAFVGPSTTQCVKLMPQEAPIILDPLNLFEKTNIFFVVNDLESPGTGGTHWSMLHWDRSAAFNPRRPPTLASIPSHDPDAMDVDEQDFEAEGESDNGNEACVELLEHYDSIFGHNRHSAAIVYDIISSYLSLHYSNSPNEPPHRLEFVERFTPQQANGADCGVYVIALVEVLCRQLIERTTGCLAKSRSTTDLRSYLNGNSQSQAPITRSHARTAFANQQQQPHPAGVGPTTNGVPLHSARNSPTPLPAPGPVPSPYGTRLATRNQQLQALLADADAVEPAELSPDFIAAKRSEWRSRILSMRPAERPHV